MLIIWITNSTSNHFKLIITIGGNHSAPSEAEESSAAVQQEEVFVALQKVQEGQGAGSAKGLRFLHCCAMQEEAIKSTREITITTKEMLKRIIRRGFGGVNNLFFLCVKKGKTLTGSHMNLTLSNKESTSSTNIENFICEN